MPTDFARAERAALVTELRRRGPDAPTLCEGWSTRDLAAHLIVRERRPDAAGGIVVPRLAARTERIQAGVAGDDYEHLLELVAGGPPGWNPMGWGPLDRLVNTVEFFVHHEDVRRATAGWEPRQLPAEEQDQLWSMLGRSARMMLRRAPAGVRLVRADAEIDPVVGRRADPSVDVVGAVGELVLFVYGRQDHARVELRGDDAAASALRVARFGV